VQGETKMDVYANDSMLAKYVKADGS